MHSEAEVIQPNVFPEVSSPRIIMSSTRRVSRPVPVSIIAVPNVTALLYFVRILMTNADSPAEKARALIARKDLIQLELETHLSILKSNNVTMQTPLVDPEGFPRADIDVWEVRTARVRIIELRNDLRDVMDEIGKALEGVYDPGLTSTTAGDSSGLSGEDDGLKPFTKVESVVPGSPSFEAGLQKGDLLVKFGHLDETSFKNGSLQPVADLVAESENRSIKLRVLRAGTVVFLTLVPRKNWGGRGMLGCHIVPYSP